MRRLALIGLTACAADTRVDLTEQVAPLSATVKAQRAMLIRDSAAEMGLHNAALLGGIATSETNLAHCWQEAQFACMGPATPSCDGGPIIAGSADGPCSAMQGGLGMFQFDAGTYAQTVSTYTDAILTIEGNTAQAVAFIVDKAKQDIAGVTDWMTAVEWFDSIPLVAGEPLTEQWSHLIACRYNGCCSASTLCESRADGYRDNAIAIRDEFGAAFWATADRCLLAEDGVIDQRSACYLAGGEPRFWVRTTGGFADSHETTKTTTAAAPSNFARWLLRPNRATTYRIEAFVQGIGAATAASYRIAHGGESTTVVVDQTIDPGGDGFVLLGDFDLVADGSEYVELGDNTGTVGQVLGFDALRVTALDGGGPGEPMDPASTGCCSTGGGDPRLLLLGLGVGAVLLRRRRISR